MEDVRNVGCEHKVGFAGTRLITFSDLEKIIEERNKMQKSKDGQPPKVTLADFSYPEKFSWIFRYCPECGEKIDWEGVRDKEKQEIPNLCKLLGVDVDEKFKIAGEVGEYYVGRTGFMFICSETNYLLDKMAELGLVMTAINHPSFVIKNRNWTKKEIEDAKTILRMFGKDNFTHLQKDEDGWPSLMDGDGKDPNVGWCSIGMEKDMFPSLQPGQTVTLDEIIGGAE